jgi:O-antigen ligase
MLSTKHHQFASGKPGIFLPALLSIALLAILFPLPQPANHVNQPFKVEFFLCVFLIILLLSLIPRRQAGPESSRHSSAPVTAIALSIAGLVLWSAASALWGSSFGAVAHHTLLWSVYLIIFVFLADQKRLHDSTRFITTTFVIVSLVLGFLCILDYFAISDFASSEGDLRIRYGKYAELLATISPVMWAMVIYARNRRRVSLMLAAAALSWMTVMLSLSKGAFIAGIIGFAIFFLGSAFFSAKGFRKRVFTFATVWLAITIGTQVFFSYFSAVPSTTSYITGSADTTRSTTAMRLFTWKVARQMASDHWLIGVGADDFGLAFNQARVRFRQMHPNDTTGEIAEDYIVERAHNEPLQILAELGAIGLLLSALPFVIFGLYCFNAFRQRHSFSPLAWASLAGLAAFAVSSQFSSFSFRAAQNGLVLFMVLALAVKTIKRSPKLRSNVTSTTFSRPVYAFGWAAALLLLVFCAVKGYAEYQAYAGERSRSYSAARAHFEAAVAADPGYAGGYLSYAARAAADGDISASALLTRKAIDNGLGISPLYSQAAKQQIASGDLAGAEATYLEAIAIYPRSVYLRTEFQVFLEDHQKNEAAAEHARIARSIDERQANGWYSMMREGSVRAFYRAQNDPNLAPPAELTPATAVLKYIDKIPGMGAPENPSEQPVSQ